MPPIRSIQAVLLFLLILSTDLTAQVEVRAHYRLGRGGGITFALAPEILEDVSGNGMDLKRSGSPRFSADAPVRPNASPGSMLFDGQADWYRREGALGQATDNFVIEVYAKARKRNHPGLHGVVANGDGGLGYALAQQGEQWVAFVGGVGALTMARIVEDQWVHLAMAADGPRCLLYVNGKKAGTFRRAASLNASFTVGDFGRGKEAFHGEINEVRISTFPDGRFDPASDLLLDYGKIKKREEQDLRRRRSIIDKLCQERPGVRVVEELTTAPVKADWLVRPITRPVELRVRPEKEMQAATMVLTNGLASRTFHVSENLACVGFSLLTNGAQFLRAVKPEIRVQLDGIWYGVGSLEGQPEMSYLLASWLPGMTADPSAFRFKGLDTQPPEPRYPWHRKFNATTADWPPRGLRVNMHYEAPEEIDPRHKGIEVTVHYEMYEGMPVIAKWFTLRNASSGEVRIDSLESEHLAVNQDQRFRIHAESDYSFALVNGHPSGSALMHYHGEPRPYHAGKGTTEWRVDPDYHTWATHNQAEDGWLRFRHHCLLVSRPPMGPGVRVAPGKTFRSFVTFELLHDSDDEESKSLGHRKLYRSLAPQVTESLLAFGITSHDPVRLLLVIDQMAELGFERLDIQAWPGIAHDNLDPDHVALWKKIADCARERGIILGGYELAVASRGRGTAYDCIDPETGKPGSLFGQSVCIASAWKDTYFPRMFAFFDKTGLKSWNADGPYHGDPCAAANHPHHDGLEDSQWAQWTAQVEVIHALQGRDCYIPIPDWYFLNGQCATGMGYREASANLSPQQQLLLGRQYIYDGTWHKTPTMGWMTLQLVGFYTNDPGVGLEPLADNLNRYERGLVQHLGSGCQFTVRGNRLYDTPETKRMVKSWVDWFKKYRAILTSDIIHVGRPTGRNIDCMLHVNPRLKTRGLAVVFNPTEEAIKRDLELPLYYTGLTQTALIREREGDSKPYALDRGYRTRVPVEIEPGGFTWLVIESPANDETTPDR